MGVATAGGGGYGGWGGCSAEGAPFRPQVTSVLLHPLIPVCIVTSPGEQALPPSCR